MSDDKDMTQHWRPGELLRVETDRFFLRSLTPDDATEAYVSWWNDPEIQEGLNAPARGWDRQRAIKHISQFDNKTRFHLGIFCKNTNKMIGFFAVFVEQGRKVAKTNVVIGDKDYWGRRVVHEVRARMLDFLFDVLKMEKVKGEIYGRNIGSIFNYKELGFTSEGILRKEINHFSGGRADVYLFGLLRDEWKARRSAVDAHEK